MAAVTPLRRRSASATASTNVQPLPPGPRLGDVDAFGRSEKARAVARQLFGRAVDRGCQCISLRH